MASYLALSVVAPAGDWIRSGKKTLEIRQWAPEQLPLRNLVIIQNTKRLSRDGLHEDPEGEVMALVDVDSVECWKESEFEQACASFWEKGWLAWKLSNIRPLSFQKQFPARLRLYPVDLPEI